MFIYLEKLMQHLSSLTHALKQLLKKDSVWIWDENIIRDFESIKKTIMQALCRYFDEKKSVILSVVASKN